MGKSILSYTYRFENTGVSQLLDNLLLVEESRTPRIVRFYAPNELWRTGHHLLQQIHQRVSEIRRDCLLSSGLRCQASTRITFLYTKHVNVPMRVVEFCFL